MLMFTNLPSDPTSLLAKWSEQIRTESLSGVARLQAVAHEADLAFGTL